MRLRLIPGATGLVWLVLSIPAYGVNCYQIWNNQDVLIYQSSRPPFDLSAPAFDRSMTNVRARRGQLIFFDATECALVGSIVVGEGQPPPDPASLLVDVRGGAGVGPRGGMLAPVPASIGVAPTGVAGGSMNARPAPGTNIGTPSRPSSRY